MPRVESDELVLNWWIDEMTRLGFTKQQRVVLREKLERGELEFSELRALIEKRGWSPEQAFLSAA
jgi:hypothetical protein